MNEPIPLNEVDTVKIDFADLSTIAETTNPVYKISHYFPEQPSKKELHLIVTLSLPPTPTLSDYLLPSSTFWDAHIPKMHCGPSVTKIPFYNSVDTPYFDPGVELDLHRIPYRVHLRDMVPKMLDHLREMLLQNPNAALPIASRTRSAYETAKGMFNEISINNKSSVFGATQYMVPLVIWPYAELTGSRITATGVPTGFQTVMADYAFLRATENEEILLLWENKAPLDFSFHTKSLLSTLTEGPFSYDLNLTGWEGWEAILAKVSLFSGQVEP